MLPEPLRALESRAEYRVEIAPALRALAERADSSTWSRGKL
jgi:hypothetical protein